MSTKKEETPPKEKKSPKETLRKALQDRREKTNGHQPTK